GSVPPAREAIHTSASAAKSSPKASAPPGNISPRFASHAASRSQRAGEASGVPSFGDAARNTRFTRGAPAEEARRRATRPPRECVTRSREAPEEAPRTALSKAVTLSWGERPTV